MKHLRAGLIGFKSNEIIYWWMDLFFLILGVLGIMDIYEGLANLLKKDSRPLSPQEIQWSRLVYGDAIPYHLVRVDEKAFLGPPQMHIAYVSGATINAWGRMPIPLLIHELMHVWQFYHLGLAYIPRALRAYHSEVGYNYGGVEALQEAQAIGQRLQSFNYEQQADIMADFMRIQLGLRPVWGNGNRQNLSTYQYFIDQAKEQNLPV